MKFETHEAVRLSRVPANSPPSVVNLTSDCARVRTSQAGTVGRLIVNADDWGRDQSTTDRILECTARKSVSSVSAMVFMADSQRAATIARASGIDAGLHLNFTTTFSATDCPPSLIERQRNLGTYLSRHKASKAIFHPGLARSFEYVVAAQVEEFQRLYGVSPERVDGHHHMHLCANVLLGGLLPTGTIARRNFSFQAGEKSWGNRFYRSLLDRILARRHRLTDFFFSLPPLEPAERLQRIFSLAQTHVVELETHPVNPAEYEFLNGGMRADFGELPIATSFVLAKNQAIPGEAACAART